SNACKIHVNAIGAIFAENALAAIGAGLAAGISLDAIARRLETAPIPAGRFEVVARDSHVVVDYAHSPDALARTLATARTLSRAKVTVVFGAGGNRDSKKRPLLGDAAKIADRVIVTNDNPRDEEPEAIAAAIREGLRAHPNVETILDRASAIESAIADAKENDVVVIAGKGHESVQIHGRRAESFSDRDVATATCLRMKRGNSPRTPNG
ncbi:MAG: glutamate ligase domain-containing protein, partial [Polyangiaceae bacterium]